MEGNQSECDEKINAIWHEWLILLLEDSESTEVKSNVAGLLTLSGLQWKHNGPEHKDFLDRLRETKLKEQSKDVRERIEDAIEALNPEIKRLRTFTT